VGKFALAAGGGWFRDADVTELFMQVNNTDPKTGLSGVGF
jgi:hypothetical protein